MYCPHGHRSNKPTTRSFCGRQATQEKISKLRNLSRINIQTFIESKEKRKTSKIKGRAERQLQGFVGSSREKKKKNREVKK
jgi:hypothetical protein